MQNKNDDDIDITLQITFKVIMQSILTPTRNLYHIRRLLLAARARAALCYVNAVCVRSSAVPWHSCNVLTVTRFNESSWI